MRDKLQRLSIYPTCSICLEDIKFDDNSSFLCNCKHVFHKKCINRWITEYKNMCPNCRTKILDSDSNFDSDFDFDDHRLIMVRSIFDIIYDISVQLHGYGVGH